jgi:protein required for attachment to host cells
MKTIRLQAGDWVVVCDGRKALILENIGDEMFPNLRTRESHQQDNPKTSEQGADRPGRVHESMGASRSGVEQTDWHDQAEQDFLTALAKRMDAAVQSGEPERLIVIAPPRALGVLRNAYSAALRKALAGEIDKDYTHLPVYEIEQRLAAKKA